jgi:hypothetical protein
VRPRPLASILRRDEPPALRRGWLPGDALEQSTRLDFKSARDPDQRGGLRGPFPALDQTNGGRMQAGCLSDLTLAHPGLAAKAGNISADGTGKFALAF